MMKYTIDQKIVGIATRAPETPATQAALPAVSDIEHMHENVGRPTMLVGATYKIKTPLSEHALYITINDIVLNPDTEYQQRRPFEIFINSKNMDHFQWVVALTRVISAVFRKGGDVTFLVEELKNVFDPKGGYFKSGGKFSPSLVAEIGEAIELHLQSIGLLQKPGLSAVQAEVLADKKQRYLAQRGEADRGQAFPASASLCGKCLTKAMIHMDGCATCLNCGDAKCG